MTVDVITYGNVTTEVIQGETEGTVIEITDTVIEQIEGDSKEVVVVDDVQQEIIEGCEQGPPGPPGSGGVTWTYVQETIPAGSVSQTWFQPSTGYGYVYVTGFAWTKFFIEHMAEDNADHGVFIDGGYY